MGTKRSKPKLNCKKWNLLYNKHEQIVPISTIMAQGKVKARSNCICAICSSLHYKLDLFQGTLFGLWSSKRTVMKRPQRPHSYIYASNSHRPSAWGHLFPQLFSTLSLNSCFYTFRKLYRFAEKSKIFRKGTPTKTILYLLRWLPGFSSEFYPPPLFLWWEGRGWGCGLAEAAC